METTSQICSLGNRRDLGSARSRGRNVPQFGVELCRGGSTPLWVSSMAMAVRISRQRATAGCRSHWVTAMGRSRRLGAMVLGWHGFDSVLTARSKVQLSRSVNSMVTGSRISRLHQPGPGRLSVLLGNGDGSFQWAFDFPLDPLPGFRSIAVGEFNSDGIQDLVVGGGESAYCWVMAMVPSSRL